MEKAATTIWARGRPRTHTRRHLLVSTSLFSIRFDVILAFSSLELRSGNRQSRFSRHIAMISESDAEKSPSIWSSIPFFDSIRRCPRFSSYVLRMTLFLKFYLFFIPFVA